VNNWQHTTGDNSHLAQPGHQDKDMKEPNEYKSINILREKRQQAISPGRWATFTKTTRNV